MREKSHSILFVDDDPTMLSILERIFGPMENYKYITAIDSKNALEKCSPEIDLVLLDIHLGEDGSDGIYVANKLRENHYDGIICMFTGDASPALLFQSVLAGANDYILKGPTCDIVKEVSRLVALGKDKFDNSDDILVKPIEESGYLRTLGLSNKETQLLSYFAEYGYPRIKEFAVHMNVSETCLWKRLARIRDKLKMDSTSQIAHLLTSISLMDVRNGSRKRKTAPHGLKN